MARSQETIMKLSLKIKLLTLSLLPFFTWALLYLITINIEEVINLLQIKSSINFANTSKDIDINIIKSLTVTSLNYIQTLYHFVDLLFTVAVLNAILIYSTYK